MSEQPKPIVFSADRQTYIRDHIVMALVGSVGMTAILYAVGNPFPWVGVAGSVIAISVRGFFIMSETLGFRWQLTAQNLSFPGERTIPLSQIKTVRSMLSAVQIVTDSGEKFLIRFQQDPQDTVARIQAMQSRQQGQS